MEKKMTLREKLRLAGDADFILEIIQDHGWRVVPMDPDEKQLTAAASLTGDAAKYRAMIDAATDA